MKNFVKVALAVTLLAGLGGRAAQAEGKPVLQVKGSDTMVHLASFWAETFMKANPQVEISVTGGGSGTGIAALINGNADIANASRTITKMEINTAKSKGFTPVEHVVGKDGIAVIVNPANPVKELSMEQIKKIYIGEFNNWKQVGGGDQKIILYTRDSSSGTYAFFQEHVLGKKDYSVKARRLASNSAITQSVSEDANSIGYVGLGYLKEAQGKVVALGVKKDEKSAAVLPSIATVKDGSYPISRGLQMYTKGEPEGAAKLFLDFIKGSEGQNIIEEMGFVKL